MVADDVKIILIKAARAGGEVLRKHFRKTTDFSLKGSIHNIVTAADKEAQAAIVHSVKDTSRATALENKVGFMGEEDLYEEGEYMFVIDPLDGTTNFASGIDHFCVSIGVIKENKVVAGVVYDVMRDILYYSILGKGAYRDEKRLHIQPKRQLNEALLLISPSEMIRGEAEGLHLLARISKVTRNFRLFGSVALDMCRMCDGSGDIVLHNGSFLWDIAAASLILTEAGGVVVNWQEAPLVFEVNDPPKIYQYVAGTKQLIHDFCAHLS